MSDKTKRYVCNLLQCNTVTLIFGVYYILYCITSTRIVTFFVYGIIIIFLPTSTIVVFCERPSFDDYVVVYYFLFTYSLFVSHYLTFVRWALTC